MLVALLSDHVIAINCYNIASDGEVLVVPVSVDDSVDAMHRGGVSLGVTVVVCHYSCHFELSRFLHTEVTVEVAEYHDFDAVWVEYLQNEALQD